MLTRSLFLPSAVNPDLTLKWAASLRDRGINDGCGVLIPKATGAQPVQKDQNNGHLFVVGEGGNDVGQNDESNGPHTPARFPEPDYPDQE